ncbi:MULTISPECIES: MMPL family transporter [Streptomyces]|uniref:Putative drug exporter of the RND superfamily n=1 Tax=Streptomyces melanosporofaciens TaxID=67327 RepID=A0A1H4UXP7_STRMJ|nr:MMPL family transporter [Streptomyces melanosporofaciens]SEC73527.1 putative drug exporter of the RND superfamily [Streptomyces melanosporofaciens]
MFGRIGRFSVHRPWLVVALWVIAAVGLAILAPPLKSSTDQADFLPSHYESVRVTKLQEQAFPQHETAAAILVYQRSDGGKLSDADKAAVAKATTGFQDEKYKTFKSVVTTPEAVSKDGKMALANVYLTQKDVYNEDTQQSIKDLRADRDKLLKGTSLKVDVTGPSASALDSIESSGDTDAMIMMATLVLIIVLLGAIFRSPLIALMPVLMILVMFIMAQGLIATASDWFGLEADSSVSAILIVVLFGVGTDYMLFLLFRYREHLRKGQQPKEALVDAVTRVGETIASAAGAVIVAFLALVLSTMGSMRAMGPSLAISVAVTLVAALTLVPAVFSLLGTKAFWPSKAWKKTPRNRLANGVGSLVSRRPGLIAAVSAGVLAALAVGALGFKAEFDTESSLPKDLESVQAMADLQKSFSAGESDPSLVYIQSNGDKLDASALTGFRQKLGAVEGVGEVSPAVLNPKGDVAQFSVVLKYRPASEKAIELVAGELRDTAHDSAPEGSKVLVGGSTAVLADIEDAVNHDYRLVFPVAGLAIMLILGLLLRSVVAPLYLMLAVGLGFAATLGSTVWLFQNVRGEHGLLFMLPIIVYLFVVAIGTDYNILMVARLREEVRKGKTPAEAARLAVAQSAPTIGSAAIILAGTFGVLMLASNSMLQQMGFAVAFGILLTAFIMALLLVPTVTAMLGSKAWWPNHRYDSPDTSGASGPGRAEEPDAAGETVRV